MNRRIGIILSYICMIFEVFSTLFLTPFILKTLGQAEFGVYKLAGVVNAYLMLLDLGVGNAVTRYISKFRADGNEIESRKFLGIATIYYSFIAIATIILGMILCVVFPSMFATGLSLNEIALGQKLLGINMINSAITLGTTEYANVVIAYEKFGVSKGSSILQIVIRIFLTYVALRLGMGSIGLVSVNLMTTILCRGFLAGYVYLKIKLKPLFKGIKWSFVKEIIIYSSYILLQMIATQINSTVDTILLGVLVSSSSAIIAIYGVGTQVVQYFQSIGSSFNSVLMPGVVKMVEHRVSDKRMVEEIIRVSRMNFMILGFIWICFMINGKNFMILWAGKENVDAFYVAAILMFANIFILSESIGTQVLWAMNRHKEQAILKIMIVMFNTFLTIILIQWNPLMGATIATFISLLFGDVGVMNLIFWRIIKMNPLYYYRKLFSGTVPCLCFTALIGGVTTRIISMSWFGFILKVSIMIMVYVTMMYIFGLTQNEKRLIYSTVVKIRK